MGEREMEATLGSGGRGRDPLGRGEGWMVLIVFLFNLLFHYY